MALDTIHNQPQTPLPASFLTLHSAPLQTPIRIESITDMSVAAQVVRMGIGPGSEVVATTRLPKGPVVVQCGAVELALGQEISQQVIVSII